jgi:polar amino acid transport system substrate-binding protein
MKLKISVKLFLAFSFLLLSHVTNSAEKITIGFGEIIAPWVLPDDNRGIIVDVIDAAMTPLGYKIEYLYLPRARRIYGYSFGDVDVISDMNQNSISQFSLSGFLSDTAYTYENFAFSLHKNHIQLSQLSDLKEHSLLAWQDAAVHLGGDYAKMVKSNPQYGETFDQLMQVKMLFLERFDVIQLDSHIFDYYRAELTNIGKIDVQQKVDKFSLVGASPNAYLFKSEKMRDEFNSQLSLLKSTGEYQKIFDRYK